MKKPTKTKGKQANGPSDGFEILDIADLLPDDKNARIHNPRNVGMIAEALQEVGTGRSGVIDEKGKVLAGNATLEALAQAGIRRVKVVESNGEEWVVVKRLGLTEKQKKRLALFDNRANETSDWNIDVLSEFKGEDLLGGLWTPEEMELLFADFKPGSVDDQSKLDGKTPITCPECGKQFIP